MRSSTYSDRSVLWANGRKAAFSADRVWAGSRQNHMAQVTTRPSDFHKGGG